MSTKYRENHKHVQKFDVWDTGCKSVDFDVEIVRNNALEHPDAKPLEIVNESDKWNMSKNKHKTYYFNFCKLSHNVLSHAKPDLYSSATASAKTNAGF